MDPDDSRPLWPSVDRGTGVSRGERSPEHEESLDVDLTQFAGEPPALYQGEVYLTGGSSARPVGGADGFAYPIRDDAPQRPVGAQRYNATPWQDVRRWYWKRREQDIEVSREMLAGKFGMSEDEALRAHEALLYEESVAPTAPPRYDSSGRDGWTGRRGEGPLSGRDLQESYERACLLLAEQARLRGQGAVAGWFADAEHVLGSLGASETFRVLMAHHFMANPNDWEGAWNLRGRFLEYMARGVSAGAGPEPGGEGSRSSEETSEEERQEMLARLKELADPADDGVELDTSREEPESGAETASRRVSWPGALTSEQRSTADSAAVVTADGATGATADAGGIAAMDGGESTGRVQPVAGPVSAQGQSGQVTLDEGRFPKDESALTVFGAGSAHGVRIGGRLLSGEALGAALAARRGGDRRPLRLIACDSAVGGLDSVAAREAARSGLPVLGVRGWVWQAKRGGRYPEGMASRPALDGSRPVWPPNGGYVLFVPGRDGKVVEHDLKATVPPQNLGAVVAAVEAGDAARLHELTAAAGRDMASSTGDAQAAGVYTDTDWAHWAGTTRPVRAGEQPVTPQSGTLGSRLQTLREEAGFSKRAAAEEAKVYYGWILHYEDGRRVPTPGALRKLLDAYDVSGDERAAVEALHDAARSKLKLARQTATLGAELTSLRIKAGLSQHEAAKRAGFGQGRIADYEVNKFPPSSERLEALLSVYDVWGERREQVVALRDKANSGRSPSEQEIVQQRGALGAKLWMLRDAAGLTRKKAAAKAGVKEWSIASVETRRTVPHADWLAALLDVYRASDAERAEVEALYHAAGGRSGAGTETTAEPETGSNPPEYKWLTGKKIGGYSRHARGTGP
ncbi:helix-turn-helix domain-containing protein [Saccharopolyspora erythraea]|uniref:helix-turn-helix domain-containing protein n=1 Tax=Saccharopolyspora erythraea TaxID=1836 RepID=UPI0012F81773|nr:helix-turn-helix domain-containing protein [Saccharopolyspora erythraea]